MINKFGTQQAPNQNMTLYFNFICFPFHWANMRRVHILLEKESPKPASR
jgi:hypothetical protein